MGGGAIKKNGVSICSRLPRAGYMAVKAHVLAILQPHVPVCEGVLELPEKSDFGDLDVLYCHGAPDPQAAFPDAGKTAAAAVTSMTSPTISEIVKRRFGVVDPTHCVRHGPVTSFAFDVKAFLQAHCPEVEAVQYFQIDLIRAPSPQAMAICRFYFGYGDIGGILGRVFNYYGLKFGDGGLWCDLFSQTVDQLKGGSGSLKIAKKIVVATDSDNAANAAIKATVADNSEDADTKKLDQVDPTATLGRVPLTNDPHAICLYAGLDYPRWCKGFTTLDEVLQWLTNCAIFQPRIFDRLNYDHMQRATKRPFYQQFLNHIHMVPGKAGATQVRRNQQLEAIAHFSQEPRMMAIIKAHELAKERKDKFNGKLLSVALLEARSAVAAPEEGELSPKVVEGKALGTAIAAFKVATIFKFQQGQAADTEGDAAACAVDKQALEASFNEILDGLGAEEIHALMILFASTYSPPAPAAATPKRSKQKK